MATAFHFRTGLLRACPFAALLLLAGAPALPAQADSGADAALPPKQITITYATHDGHRRNAYVLLPDGYGRRLPLHSWGYTGQIADLARMPAVVEAALPYVHIDRHRLYGVGGSMGAQETLLLVGRYPHLLAGAVAVDGPADFALQYRNFPKLACTGACRARWG